MKLRNKQTGEIKAFDEVMREAYKWNNYNSLAELNAEWEDYEEPKEYWCIDWTGDVNNITVLDGTDIYEKDKKEIGNYFSSREEAEKAVEKLRAWKRLKDKGFRLNHWKEAQLRPNMSCVAITGNMNVDEEAKADLDLLFGGEE